MLTLYLFRLLKMFLLPFFKVRLYQGELPVDNWGVGPSKFSHDVTLRTHDHDVMSKQKEDNDIHTQRTTANICVIIIIIILRELIASASVLIVFLLSF